MIKYLLHIVCLFVGLHGWSQQFEIKGKIKSSEGDPIPGAFVVLGTQKTQTDAEGRYFFENIEKGAHIFKIQAYGFNSMITQIEVPQKKYDFQLVEFGVELDSSIVVIAKNMEEEFGIGYAPPIQGTVIYDGKNMKF